MKTLSILILIVVMFVFASCGPTQETDTGVHINRVVDPVIYKVTVQIEDEIGGYSQQNFKITDYNGYTSGVSWANGKGIVRGTITNLDPQPDWAEAEQEIVLKTTDWKVTALFPGDVVTMYCLADYEPVCSFSKDSNSKAGECKDIWEFDYCRMVTLEKGTK